MRRTMSFTIVVLLIAGSTAFAQQNKIAPSEEREDLRQLMEITHASALIDKISDRMVFAYKRLMPTVPEEVWDKFRKGFNGSDAVELLIPVYSKYFTREDVKGLIDFYRSPLGKKLLENREAIMQESMAIGFQWGQEISAKIAAELRSKGYRVPRGI